MFVVMVMAIMNPMLAFSQVEEQEGNAMGKLQKLQEVMEKCEQVVTLDYMKDDCFKMLNAINTNLTALLKDNRNSIEHILYGS